MNEHGCTVPFVTSIAHPSGELNLTKGALNGKEASPTGTPKFPGLYSSSWTRTNIWDLAKKAQVWHDHPRSSCQKKKRVEEEVAGVLTCPKVMLSQSGSIAQLIQPTNLPFF